MALLIIGLVLFIGTHVFASLREVRSAVIAAIGRVPIKVPSRSFPSSAYCSWASGLANIARPAGQTCGTRRTGPITSPSCSCGRRAYSLLRPISAAISGARSGTPCWSASRLGRWRISSPMATWARLFCSAHFLLWAAYDRISLKHRADPGAPALSANGRRNDVIAIVVGTVLYLLLGLVFHPLVVGRAVFGRPAF
jgi:NnrU protein